MKLVVCWIKYPLNQVYIYIYTLICKQFCGEVLSDIYLISVYQRCYLLTIYRWFIFHLERSRGETTIIHRKPQQKKHPSIKFNFKHSKIEIEFPDPKIYKNTNGKRCLAIYRKATYRQNYLNFKSAHPPSLKEMIPCSRRRRISGICTETNEVTKRLTELKVAFLIRGYQKRSIDYQFNRLNHQKH